jgi:hypothetical protein
MNASGGRSARGGSTASGAGVSHGGAAPGAAGLGAAGQALAAGQAGAETSGGQGGTSGQAGDPDPGVPVEGIPGIGAFSSFTLRFLSGDLNGNGYCSGKPAADENVLTYERATHTLSYDFCRVSDLTTPATPFNGSMTLTGPEVQALLIALSYIEPVERTGCLSDSTVIDFEVDVDGTKTTYEDDVCPSDPNERLVGGTGALMRWLMWLPSHALPAKPAKFKLSTGEAVPAKPNACVTTPSPQDYELDLATGKVTWSWCAIDPGTEEHLDPWPSASATLDSTKLAAVLQAYAGLTLGVSTACASLPKPASVDMQGGRPASLIVDDTVDLADETAACYGYVNANGWTIGVAALTHLVLDNLPQ